MAARTLRLPWRTPRTLNDYARKANVLKESDANLTARTCARAGGIVSVRLSNPQFEGRPRAS